MQLVAMHRGAEKVLSQLFVLSFLFKKFSGQFVQLHTLESGMPIKGVPPSLCYLLNAAHVPSNLNISLTSTA